MAGYFNYSMSNNAIAAYRDGEKPISKWTKKLLIENVNRVLETLPEPPHFKITTLNRCNVDTLRNLLLVETSWHHTGKMYNRTVFYSFQDECIPYITENLLLEKLEEQQEEMAEKKAELEAEPEYYECKFLEWTGKGRYMKAKEYTEIGIIKGNFFIRKNGSKKNINAKGFQIIREV